MLLAIAGRKRVGKTTLAGLLKTEFPRLTIRSWAQPIKDFFGELYGWGPEHEDGKLKEKLMCCRIPTATEVADCWIAVERKHRLTTPYEMHEFVRVFFSEFRKFVHKGTAEGTSVYLMSPRWAYQVFGTEVGRKVAPGIWTNDTLDDSIYTDGRFDDELDVVRARGGRVIHVTRPHMPRIGMDNHASEQGVEFKPGDLLWVNDKTGTERPLDLIMALKGL